MGNYIPKCTQNRYMGIKVIWAYSSKENWTMTHRFAGKVWFIGGIVVFLTALLPMEAFMIAFFAILLVLILLPTVYSYRFYQKQLAAGEIEPLSKTVPQKRTLVTGLTVVITLIVVILILSTGGFEITLTDDSLAIDAGMYDLTLPYADIETVEYREEGVPGTRINGIGSAKLLLGWFKNEELGVYSRYTYTPSKPCIVITTKDETVVINCLEPEDTQALYQQLLEKIG